MSRRMRGLAPPLVLCVAAVAGCAQGGALLANPTPAHSTTAPSTPGPVAIGDPQPIELPRDDGPHDRLTEWWYYTGHLRGRHGERFGFEFVIFRAERGRFPTSWASHLALTDETGGRFMYAQRAEVGPDVDPSAGTIEGGDEGFDLAITGRDPSIATTLDQLPWSMRGAGGTDQLAATLSPAEATAAGSPAGLGLALDLRAAKAPVLHDRDGWIDFGPAGGSYYYSRTRMDARGTVTIDGGPIAVTGEAWFDHQWGDFISVGGGGWDWFAVNLDDGTDLTLSLVRDADGSYPLVYGTSVNAAGSVEHLERDDFSVEVTDRWVSPRTAADYPAGWIVTIPRDDLRIDLRPTVPDQELDTRRTTGVVYWEGSQTVRARRGVTPLAGQAYVELTGYASSVADVP